MSTFVDPRTLDGYKSQRPEKQTLLLLGAILDQQIIANGKDEPPAKQAAPEPKKPDEPPRRTLAVPQRRG